MDVPDHLTDAQLAAWCAFQQAQVRVGGLLARELGRATGLSEADYQVLEALVRAPDGRMRAFDLRCVLGWEKSRLSHQLRRMERRGLVERSRCEVDGRGTDITLTVAGRQAANDAITVRATSVHRHVVSQLDERRLALLTHICNELTEHATQADSHVAQASMHGTPRRD